MRNLTRRKITKKKNNEGLIKRYLNPKFLIYLVIGVCIFLTTRFVYERVLIYQNNREYVLEQGRGDYLSKPDFSVKPNNILLWISKDIDEDHSFIEELYIVQVGNGSQIRVLAFPTKYYFFPTNITTPVAVKDLVNLGIQKEPRQDVTYVTRELQSLLGFNFDRYIRISDEEFEKFVGNKKAEDSLIDNTSRFIKIFNVLSDSNSIARVKNEKDFAENINTNLSIDEYKYFLSEINKSNSKVTIQYVGESYLKDNELYMDKEFFNTESLDPLLRTFFENLDVLKEQARVEVYNGTDQFLLANRWRRVFTNSGLDITRVGTAKIRDKTEIYIARDNLEVNLSLVKKLLNSDAEIINSRPEFTTTGDIIIILGEDIVTKDN